MFQHTAARRRLVIPELDIIYQRLFQHTAARRRLGLSVQMACMDIKFQHTAARRRLGLHLSIHQLEFRLFQHTAARRRLVSAAPSAKAEIQVSTHSRPKAAGARLELALLKAFVSTHSRPKAAGPKKWIQLFLFLGFNTQPPEGGWLIVWSAAMARFLFQHTAARRRLGR